MVILQWCDVIYCNGLLVAYVKDPAVGSMNGVHVMSTEVNYPKVPYDVF
jgi:hypothetical protein